MSIEKQQYALLKYMEILSENSNLKEVCEKQIMELEEMKNKGWTIEGEPSFDVKVFVKEKKPEKAKNWIQEWDQTRGQVMTIKQIMRQTGLTKGGIKHRIRRGMYYPIILARKLGT